MGPNLTRLFAEKRSQADCDEARDLIADMFDTHGEALIAALERVEDEFHCCCYDLGKTCIVCDSVALLAQLESEAQP